MIEARNVAKTFHHTPVLRNVNLKLRRGVGVVVKAPNGSGKTTLLRVLAGLLRPTQGEVLWDGQPLRSAHRRCLGVLFEDPLGYADLTCRDNLYVLSRLYDVRDSKAAIGTVLRTVGMHRFADLPLRQLSKGQQKRFAFARLLLYTPQVLFLDEPMDGLDEDSRRLVSTVLFDMKRRGSGLMIAAHEKLPEELVDCEMTIHRGQLEELT